MPDQHDPREIEFEELLDLVRETRDRVKTLERRLRKVERKIAEEIDFELLDEEEEDD